MNDFKYNPIDYDEPVRTDMINVVLCQDLVQVKMRFFSS